MRTFALLLALCALFSGCGRNTRDTSLYQRSGRSKPIVAVMPVIDSSRSHLCPWDVSQELTEEMRLRIYDSPRLYLLKGEGPAHLAKQLSTPNPAALADVEVADLAPVEFIVLTELLEQSVHRPNRQYGKAAPRDLGGSLTLGVRLRVLDVREARPKIILQEVIEEDFQIAAYMEADYTRDHWGTPAYSRTPLGMAHNKMVREIVSRVEGYVASKKG